MIPKFEFSPGSSPAQMTEEESKREKSKQFCGIRERVLMVEIFICVLLKAN